MSLLCRFLRPLPVEAAPSLDTTGPLKAAHVCHLIHRWPALPWPALPSHVVLHADVVGGVSQLGHQVLPGGTWQYKAVQSRAECAAGSRRSAATWLAGWLCSRSSDCQGREGAWAGAGRRGRAEQGVVGSTLRCMQSPAQGRSSRGGSEAPLCRQAAGSRQRQQVAKHKKAPPPTQQRGGKWRTWLSPSNMELFLAVDVKSRV
jgi:hypothetical protein